MRALSTPSTAFNTGLEARVWFEYVASKANIADFPSRSLFGYLTRLGSVARPPVLPDISRWDCAAQEWALAAAAAGCSASRSRALEGEAVRPRRRKR